MDKTVVILIIVLLFALGIFAIIQLGGADTASSVSGTYSYPSQYGGGGCGR